MVFEAFISKGGKFVPQIIINKYGGFTLSSGMHHRYGIDKYIGVMIYFDKDGQRIGVKLLDKEETGMFKLKKSENEKGAFFSARSFLGAYNLDPQKISGRYAPEEITDPNFGKMFAIDLNQNKSKS